MGAQCCAPPPPKADPTWRRALWIALIVNATMFLAEMVAGVASHSLALRADALDFLGDSANYALSLAVSSMALAWRSGAALIKGVTLALFGVWILASSLWGVWHGTAPQAETMGAVGLVALAANVGVALLLFRHRRGEANMRSIWICSRNDGIGNLAVLIAAGRRGPT